MRHKSTIRYYLLLGVIIMAQFCHAQMMYDTLTLGELEIFAEKADYTSTVKNQSIDSVFLKRKANSDLGDLLSSYTPVFIRSYGKGSLASASFRGTGANHTQLLWNDFRINSPMLGQSDLSLVPNFFFDRVELYYGGASLLKSEGGLGGSINLYNNDTEVTKPLFRLSQSYGSFNTWAADAGIVFGGKTFSSDTRLIYQSSKNNFDYYNDAVLPSKTMQQENASYYNGGFVQHFMIRPAKGHLIRIGSWTQWNHQDIPSLMAKAESANSTSEYSDNFFSRNFMAWSYQTGRSVLEAKAAWFYDNYTYHQVLRNSEGFNDTLIDSENKVNKLSGKVKYTLAMNKGFRIVTGLDYDQDKAVSNNYADDKTRNSVALYGRLEKKFRERVKLNLLLRSQLTDGKLLPLMPLIGLNVRLLKNKNFYFRMSLSRNYHLPTLNDLYWFPNGNDKLKPEQGNELEGGFNYVGSIADKLLIKADLTAFVTNVSNWIQWVDTGTGLWEPQNLTRVLSRGFEATTTLDGDLGKISYLLFLEYAYTRTTQLQTDNHLQVDENYQLIYIPVHAANADLHLAMQYYFIDWHLHYTGRQNFTGGTLEAYLLNDLMTGKSWQWGKSMLQVTGKVYNIFNVSYQAVAGRAMPGRSYEIKINYNFN